VQRAETRLVDYFRSETSGSHGHAGVVEKDTQLEVESVTCL
jgi:hypothetical protein